jgi:hypothetical protein
MSMYLNSVLSYVGSGLATGCSLVQGVLLTVCKIHNFRMEWKQTKDPNTSMTLETTGNFLHEMTTHHNVSTDTRQHKLIKRSHSSRPYLQQLIAT